MDRTVNTHLLLENGVVAVCKHFVPVNEESGPDGSEETHSMSRQ